MESKDLEVLQARIAALEFTLSKQIAVTQAVFEAVNGMVALHHDPARLAALLDGSAEAADGPLLFSKAPPEALALLEGIRGAFRQLLKPSVR